MVSIQNIEFSLILVNTGGFFIGECESDEMKR